MIDSVYQGDVQIDHVHNAALCRESGERLVVALGSQLIEMPLHFMPSCAVCAMSVRYQSIRSAEDFLRHRGKRWRSQSRADAISHWS